MNLKFRLSNGNIYEFKGYKGYSELIENLEPEPDGIMNVIDSFTIEDFENAHIEYNKFIKFKEAINDIIIQNNFWSKYELKEFSEYNLNNDVLKWLMIRESKEDKEIKEKLSLKSFGINNNLYNFNRDSIIFYYLVSDTNEDKFISCCQNGHIKTAQWIYSLGDVDIHIDNNVALKLALDKGNLEIVNWLYSIDEFN